MCVPAAGWAAVSWGCGCLLAGVSVCEGETSAVGVCLDPWECVCACVHVCKCSWPHE